MAFNMYKQIDKIKQELKDDGYTKDIPQEVFGTKLMMMFGMKKVTAISWIRNYVTVGLITHDDFIVNFTKVKN